METKTIFKNAGESWSHEEDEQLNKLYNEDKLGVMEISKIHNRAPGGIISRLCKHNYVQNRMSVRGYIEYTNSEIYKEKRKKESLVNPEKKVKTTKQLDNILISINKTDYIELKTDVNEMKNDIKELKNTVKELVEMMKAVYEFENA